MIKEVKDSMMTMTHQIKNINKVTEIIEEEPNEKFGVKKHNN